MIVKYKVTDFAKDTGLPVRKILDTLAAIGIEGKKNSSVLEEKDLNALLDRLSRDNSEADLSAFLNSAKPEPAKEAAPAAKANAPKAAAKNNDKAGKGGSAQAADNSGKQQAQAAKNNNNNGNNARKNQPQQPHKKRDEKTVSFSELARETGTKASAAEAVEVKRESNQVTVDTRTVDVNVDRFDVRYDDLASTKNTENRRKPTPQGNKQKFSQRTQRQRQQFQKGKRETEAERMQRIQLEKARNAQLKVSIPDEITIADLAARLKQQASKVIAKCMQMGEMHAINDVIDFDTACLIAEEFLVELSDPLHVLVVASAVKAVLVLDLAHEDWTAVVDHLREDLREKNVEPVLKAALELLVRAPELVLLEHLHKPVWEATEVPLGADERTRPEDDVDAVLGADLDELDDIGVALPVELALARLVEVPRHVGLDGVEAHRLEVVERVVPVARVDAEVVDGAGKDRERLSVKQKLIANLESAHVPPRAHAARRTLPLPCAMPCGAKRHASNYTRL